MPRTPDQTTDAFVPALRDLMAVRDVSFRQLARLSGYSLSYMSALATEHRGVKPSPKAMEAIARALGVEPGYFREYREHMAARTAGALAARVGLDPVLEALAAVDEKAAVGKRLQKEIRRGRPARARKRPA